MGASLVEVSSGPPFLATATAITTHAFSPPTTAAETTLEMCERNGSCRKIRAPKVAAKRRQFQPDCLSPATLLPA